VIRLEGAWWLAAALVTLVACRSARPRTAVPEGLDPASVPNRTIEVTAERFEYTPGEIRVAQGTLVTLKVTALDATHGIAFEDFGIDVELPRSQSREIRIYAAEKGEHVFRCSRFCGLGHYGMKGKLIVE